MNSSNLALRMDADEASGTLPEAAPEQAPRETGVPRRRIYGPRAFELRALDRRTIVIRDSGLQLFNVRA